jgi:hypothetical protein
MRDMRTTAPEQEKTGCGGGEASAEAAAHGRAGFHAARQEAPPEGRSPITRAVSLAALFVDAAG